MTLPTKPRAAPRSEWLPIVLMGVLLAAVVYVAVFYEPPGSVRVDTAAPPVIEESTPPPELDPEVLALARDTTRTERLQQESEPLRHLLEKSLRVTPAVARKLGLPEQPVPIAQLRRDPDRYRGRYLWYKGRLEYLSEPKPGHPVPGYDYYEGRLRTDGDDPVLFAFSLPPDEGLEVGDWVRVEGFFLKLRDAYLPAPLDLAPMLVGPALLPAYRDWASVEALDPSAFAALHDGRWNAATKKFDDDEDMAKLLGESQDVPLWHLASYALHREETVPDASWAGVPAFVLPGQLEAIRRGDVERGTPMRLLGTFVQGRIVPAQVNPLGIESWSEVWLQVRDLGGMTIPIWIPAAIDRSWGRGKDAVVHAYFFRRYTYTTVGGDERWTPLFVAAKLRPFELPSSLLTNPITFTFAGIVILVGLVFFVTWRRDRRQSQRHEDELVRRRRRRRSGAPAAVGEQACTS